MPSMYNLILNAIGLNLVVENQWIKVAFAWYVSFYIVTVLFICIIFNCFSVENKLLKCIYALVTVLLAATLIYLAAKDFMPIYVKREILHIVQYEPTVIIGILFARYNIFEKIKGKIKKWEYTAITNIVYIAMIAMSVVARYMLNIPFIASDFIIVPVMIFAILELARGVKKTMPLKMQELVWKTVTILAVNSMNLWYLHGIFFTPNKTLQGIVYLPHYGIPIFIWAFIMCLPFAVVISKIQNSVLMKLRLR